MKDYEDGLVGKIQQDIEDSIEHKSTKATEWEDERKCYVGDQWNLSFMKQKKDRRTKRPSSTDNIIFPAVDYKKYVLTANTPDTVVRVLTPDILDDGELDDKSKMLTNTVESILYRNRYEMTWTRVILQGLMHGPLIGRVAWDGDRVGGAGEDRYIGEVDVDYLKKEDFFADPSVDDWERNLQDCSFVIERQTKDLSWFKKKYKDKAHLVQPNEDIKEGRRNEDNTYLYLYYHKGTPKEIPSKWKEIFNNRKERADNPLSEKKYEGYSKGEFEGVHLAVYTDNVLLEYIPYIYEDGLYPFSYKVIHVDEHNQWGFGEIKNMIQPQVLLNLVDEMEAEAYSKQGLGGYMYQKGALNPQQKKALQENSHKGGSITEVDWLQGIKEQKGPGVPNSIFNYKSYKYNMAGEIGGYTNIQKGETKSGTPWKAIKDLGARADTRTVGLINKASMFHREIVELIISRIKEFYTGRRAFIGFENNVPFKMEFEPGYIKEQWKREISNEEGMKEEVIEDYYPEMDIRVNIVDAKPTEREYYINLANMMHDRGLIDRQSYLETIESGKLPQKEIILQRLNELEQQQMEALMAEQQMEQGVGQAPPQQGNLGVPNQEFMYEDINA